MCTSTGTISSASRYGPHMEKTLGPAPGAAQTRHRESRMSARATRHGLTRRVKADSRVSHD